jgi:hypothetical protein
MSGLYAKATLTNHCSPVLIDDYAPYRGKGDKVKRLHGRATLLGDVACRFMRSSHISS